MKRILSLLLGATMLFALCSCEKKEVNYAKAPENAATQRGAWNDGVFEGEFSDISFALPAGWEIVPDEDIQNAINITDGLTYDMMCQNNATGSNVAVIYEELLKTVGSKTITEEEYLKTVSGNLTGLGFYVTEPEKKTLGKHEFYVVTAHGEGEGVTVDQYSFVRKENGYMISVIVTAANGESFESIERSFS